jgi:PAS domain S-box-containing protein
MSRNSEEGQHMEPTNEVSILKDKLKKSQTAQKELRRTVAELNDFMENGSLPLHCINGSGVIIWANKKELELLGYEHGEYIGRHFTHFHVDRRVAEDAWDKLIKHEILENFPARLKCKDGTLRYVLINTSVYMVGSKFIHTRCFTQDVTSLRMLEKKKIDIITDLQAEINALKTENTLLKEKLGIKSL